MFSLRLEWNQIGATNPTTFSAFCDALGSNKSLIKLDLRNNDISHVGGSELAAALKRNVTLRVLGVFQKCIVIKNVDIAFINRSSLE